MSKYDNKLKLIRKEIESLMENRIDDDESIPGNIIFELAQLHLHLSEYFKKPWHEREQDQTEINRLN